MKTASLPDVCRYLWAVLAALACAASTVWAAPAWAQTATLQSQDQRVALWQSLQIVQDPEGRYTHQEAADEVAAGHADSLPHANATYGKWLPHPYWARFDLHNPAATSQRWLISFEQPTQDGIALWQQTGATGGWTALQQPEQERPFALGSGHLYPIWRIELLAGQSHNLVRFPMYAVRDETFVQEQQGLHLGLGFVLTVPLVVMLYGLTLLRVAEDKSLPLFLAMAACEMVGASWVCGLMHEVLPWIGRPASGWIGWAAYVGMLGLSCLHAKVFMQTRQNDRLAHAVLTAGVGVWLLGVPLIVGLWPESVRLTLVLGGTAHAFTMTWLALRGLRRQPGAVMGLFVSVWLVYAASAVLYLLYRVAQLPVYVSLMSSVVQGSLVAALLGSAVGLQIVRRRAELQLLVERAQDRSLLYASAHHDLLQPLQSIGLYMQTLPMAGEAQRQQLHKNMNAALSAVNDFMAGLQQLSADQPAQVQLQHTTLQNALAPVIEEYRHWCRDKHITLRYVPAREALHTDPQQLQRIARNLLSNALRYTQAGGRILIGCRRREGHRWLVVMDTGCGMTQEQATQCFEAFKRFAPPHSAPEGMGLGLYSVKQTAHALGLKTLLRSVPGKGTAVWLSLGSSV
jgi:signal transduction histidine kinase